MTTNPKILSIIFIIVHSQLLMAQPADTTLSQPLTGVQLIQATNSITFLAGFSYDAGSVNSMLANVIPTTNNNYNFTEPQESGSLQVNTSYPVGSINGTINVGPTGAANYTIPIDIPPGRNGMKPNLSLIYNSQAGDGLLGLGWGLSGLSSITRVPTDFYHEGYIDVVDFDNNDKLALDGQRLIPLGGDQYRTENETFSKITLFGSSTNPTSFKVETKDGLELYYGNTTDSRIKAKGTSNYFTWNLNQVKDKNGNYYAVTYAQDTVNGEYHPLNINYSCYGTSSGDYTVEFGYESRAVPIKTYINGSQVLVNKLMDLVTIKYGTTVVGKMQLVYSNSKIGEIIKFGKNNTRLNSTYVNWGNANTGLVESNRPRIRTLTSRYQGDFNGDGKTDLIVFSGNPDTCSLYLADPSGQLQFFSSQILASSYQTSQVYQGDFNGDGQEDLLIFRLISGNYYCSFLTFTGTSFITIDNSSPFSSPSYTYFTGDFNGDGKTDLMIKTDGYNNCLIYSFSFQFGGSSSFTLIGQCSITWGTGTSWTIIKEVPFDMNGDGKTELMCLDQASARFYGLQDGTMTMYQICSTTLTDNTKVNLFGDFNSDGMTDIYSFDANNNWKILFSTGNGFIQQTDNTFSGFNPYITYNNYYARDMDGDGKSDIVVIGRGTNINNPVKIYIGYSNGQSFNLQTYTPASSLQVSPGYNYFGDYNGDDVTDFYYDDGVNIKLINTYRGRSQYLVSNVKNGFGYSAHLGYGPLTSDTLYYKGTVPSFPVTSLQTPIYVVSSISVDNPDFSHSTTCYSYYGGHFHKQGKGFLGFEKVTSLDSASSIKSVDEFEYNSTFYNISLKKKSIYTLATGPTSDELVSDVTFTNAVNNLGSQRYFAYVSSSVENNYLTGITVTKHNTYDSNGNLTSYREDFDDGSYNLSTSSNFSSAGTWLPARPQSVTITKKHYQDSQTSSLTTNLTYYSATGQVNTKTIGPLTSTFTYDIYGNLTVETISDGSTSRTNHFTYDTPNMFVWKSYNALDHVTERTYDYTNGNVLTEKTPDNVVASYTYNDFGILTNKSISASGQSQTYTYGWTTGTRPLGSVYYKQVTTAGAPSMKEYFDYLGRVLRTEKTGFDGALAYQSTVYNKKGQVSENSLPYKQSDTPLKIIFTYDKYGRKTNEASPAGITTITYSGKTIQVSKSGQTSSKTSDSQGNIVNATDNAGNITYSFKSIGKPGTISTGGSTWSMTYDTLGRQLTLTDPDAGTVTYRYDKFNQLIKQTDARGKIDSLTYDLLGRVSTEVRSAGTKVYTYDPSGTPGLIDSVTYSGGSERYVYDNYSRLISKTVRINGSGYSTSFTYDSLSRLKTYTYPSGFAIKNVYNTSGYQSEVRRNDNNALIFQGQSVNAFGQFTQYQYGNNLTTTKTYDYLGMLSNITTGSVQNMNYSFDQERGNLLSRKDNIRNLTEIFSYDNLDRLTGINGPAPLTMTYSSNGNILSKTGIGNYSYTGPQPHAVSSVDNPGSIISTTRQRLTLTSFNKADSIIQGNLIYILAYGANDQRTISKLFNSGTLQKTVYYMDGYEKEVTPGNHIRQLHYIRGVDGLAAIFVRNDGLDTMYYIHKDHLGSINVITNQNGAVVQNLSFDAWGRRRNATDWTYNNVPSTFLFSRGFTGHEHLDQFDLINMGGRIYDPILARIISPDNDIQAPGDSQSYNRYSYCLNNPLMYIDPSGYNWWHNFCNWVSENWKVIVSTTVAIAVTVATAGLLGPCIAGIAGLGAADAAISTACIAGMAGGFAGGALNAGLNGGNLGQCLLAGFMGGVIGGLGGALSAGITSAIGYGLNSTFPNFNGAGLRFFSENETLQGSLASMLPSLNRVINGVSNGALASAISGGFFGGLTSQSLISPLYTSSSLSYNGVSLDWINNYSDGSSRVIHSWPAVSGGRYPLCEDVFNGRIPNGPYNLTQIMINHGGAGYCRDGVDFYASLDPEFTLPPARTGGFQIHPDGGYYGTNGCIGIQSDYLGLQLFYKTVSSYLRRSRLIKVNVKY